METSRARRSRARQRWETRAPVREIPPGPRRHPPPRTGADASPPWTERSRSRSPGASSTHSAGSSASDSASAYAAQITTHLNHLPRVGSCTAADTCSLSSLARFGTRPSRIARAPGRREAPRTNPSTIRATATRETSMAWGRSDAHGRARQSTRGAGGGGDGGGFGLADRRKYSSTGSRGDAASTWRKKKPTFNTPPGRNKRWTRRGEASEAGTWRAEAPSSAPERRAAVSVVVALFLPISRERRRARSHVARPKRCFGRRGTRVVRGFSSRKLGGVDVCSDASRGSHRRLGAADPLWGGRVAGRTLARRDAPERSRRRNEGTGGAHEGSDVAGHVARVRRRVRRARRGKRKGKEGRRGKGGGDEGSGKPRVWGGRLLCIDTLYQ